MSPFSAFVSAQFQVGYASDGDQGTQLVAEWLAATVACAPLARRGVIAGEYGIVTEDEIHVTLDELQLQYRNGGYYPGSAS